MAGFFGAYFMVLLAIFIFCIIIVTPIAIVVMIFKGIVLLYHAWRNRRAGHGECMYEACHRKAESTWEGARVCGMHYCWLQEHTKVTYRKT
jgi:hypothetical protein